MDEPLCLKAREYQLYEGYRRSPRTGTPKDEVLLARSTPCNQEQRAKIYGMMPDRPPNNKRDDLGLRDSRPI